VILQFLCIYKPKDSRYTEGNPRGRDESSRRIVLFARHPGHINAGGKDHMTATSEHILIVDDEPGITEHLSRILEKAGFMVTVASDGEEALELIRTIRPDLVLLDIGLPKLDGRLVLLRIRGDGDQTPVILLTKFSDIASEVVVFELGADDYIGKPFNGEVVVARIRAVLRRTHAGKPSLARSTKLCSGELLLDRTARRAYCQAEDLQLKPKGFALLECLMLHPGEVLGRNRLLDDLGWDDPLLINRHMTPLRHALGDDPKAPKFIETIRNEGYRFIKSVEVCE
jgi:DNA-binding response OmpR family regulator